VGSPGETSSNRSRINSNLSAFYNFRRPSEDRYADMRPRPRARSDNDITINKRRRKSKKRMTMMEGDQDQKLIQQEIPKNFQDISRQASFDSMSVSRGRGASTKSKRRNNKNQLS
jgi:hypothetical protein